MLVLSIGIVTIEYNENFITLNNIKYSSQTANCVKS
jgi:hypothetical protein